MRKIVFAAAIAGAALSLAACSEKTEDAAGTTVDSAMADTEANAQAAGDTVDSAATTAAAAATDASAAVEADVQGESTAEAKAD
ncbi:MAG: hypothetical protein ABIT16_03930 [Croceibacterium sp.]